MENLILNRVNELKQWTDKSTDRITASLFLDIKAMYNIIYSILILDMF